MPDNRFSPGGAMPEIHGSHSRLVKPQLMRGAIKAGFLTIIFGMLAFSAGPKAYGQWQTSGSNINNSNTGNVGIGTTSPSQKLEVNGNILATGQLQSNGADGASVSADPTIASGTDSSVVLNAKDTSHFSAINFRTAGTADRFIVGFNVFTGDNAATLQLGNASSLIMSLNTNGNVGIGTASPQNKLHVAGSITVDGNINAKYQDVAEWVPSSAKLTPGTVVILDPTKSNQVTSSSSAYDTRVAGVVSAQPGIALGEKSDAKALVATTGRVKVKVDASKGPIHIGDLLVTSDTPGLAMKSEPVNLGGARIHRPGTLIGKALEPLEKGQGEILVLLSLQ
jgi:hypothetical protein